MHTKSRLFYLLLLAVLLLLLAIAYLLRPHPVSMMQEGAPAPSLSPVQAPVNQPVLTTEELTRMLDYPKTGVPSAQDILQRAKTAPANASSGLPVAANASRVQTAPAQVGYALAPQAVTAHLPHPVQTNSNQKKTVFPAPKVILPTQKTNPSRTNRISSSPVGFYRQRGESALSSVFSGNDEAAQRREKIYSSLPQLTQKEQKAMDRRLQNFSAGLERAIANAVLPKSKREQNIEKYLARARGEKAVMDNASHQAQSGQLGDATQEVMERLASQSKGIVDDIRSSYGDSAASEAQSIMNDFQKEMGDTLNAPGDPQEKQIRANAVNNKYNQKLQQLNQNEALKKLEIQLRAEDEEYLQKLSEVYGADVSAAARSALNENIIQKMAVYATPQATEEANRKLLELDAKKKKDIEKIIRTTMTEESAAGAGGKLVGIQNELTEGDITDKVQELLDGKRAVEPYREGPKDRKPYQDEWKREASQHIEALKSYAPQYAAEAQSLFDSLSAYRNKIRDEAIQNGTDSYLMLRDDMQKTKEIQEKLQELEARGREDAIRNQEEDFNSQNDRRIQEITKKFPVDDNTKKQWADKARPVMEKYNQQRAALNNQVKTQQEYEQKMKEIGEMERKELEKIEISLPASAQ